MNRLVLTWINHILQISWQGKWLQSRNMLNKISLKGKGSLMRGTCPYSDKIKQLLVLFHKHLCQAPWSRTMERKSLDLHIHPPSFCLFFMKHTLLLSCNMHGSFYVCLCVDISNATRNSEACSSRHVSAYRQTFYLLGYAMADTQYTDKYVVGQGSQALFSLHCVK